MKKSTAIALVAGLAASVVLASDLLDVRTVLGRIESTSADDGQQATGLLAEIQAYRQEVATLPGEVAAQRWMTLLDRAARASSDDEPELDPLTMSVAGTRSIFASLPSPAAWPELQRLASERARKNPQDMGAIATRLATEALNADTAAMQVSLTQLQSVAADQPPQQRQVARAYVQALGTSVASLYGTREDIVARFVSSLEQVERGDSSVPLQVPDLVTLTGTEKATGLVRRSLTSPVAVEIAIGDETRSLAQRLALENPAALRAAHWSLVDSMEGARLYEVFQERFGDAGAGLEHDYNQQEARIYYLLHTIVSQQQDKAEKVLATLSRDNRLHLPSEAVEALRKANQNEALVLFLQGALEKNPDLMAWDVYIEQAAYVGRSAQALALVQKTKARTDLNAHLRADLARREAEALLATNRIDEAIAAMRTQIAAPPRAGDASLTTNVAVALRLAKVGLLLERSDLTKQALAYATTASDARPAQDSGMGSYEHQQTIAQILALYRRAGDALAAQNLALREINRKASAHEAQLEEYGLAGADTSKRNALIEVAALYEADKRYQEVIALLQQAKQWGARDLGEFVDEKDSLGVPIGMIAARALAETGSRDEAIRTVRALIHRLPGYDPAYELLVKLRGAEAVQDLDALYARDQFEERPLIWKARVLLDSGNVDQAEQVIRRAIAIDPSDGEQGINDRLRAYSVLADVVEAKGDRQAVALYRKAIEAIRISERADEFHAAGLYDRAFAMYRDALSRFSDAYCIQSRLAIQLSAQGRHSEAVAHYRRAYELMPDSFGRVESHCFGCESVFKGAQAQSIAEEVFLQALKRDNQKPQTHYLLGYLREEQGRYAEALQSYRNAVSLDGDYLNAWRRLDGLGNRMFIETAERDIARLKLLRLDPRQLHVSVDLTSVANLRDLWNEAEQAATLQAPSAAAVYRLAASAQRNDDAVAGLPPGARKQMEQYLSVLQRVSGRPVPNPQRLMSEHVIVAAAIQMMDPGSTYY